MGGATKPDSKDTLTMRDAITPAQREKLRQLMRDRWQRDGRGPRVQTGRDAAARAVKARASKPQGSPQSND